MAAGAGVGGSGGAGADGEADSGAQAGLEAGAEERGGGTSQRPGSVPEIPPVLVAFAARFNAGEFWESHEVLEGAWREDRSEFYHGLILYASAWVHLQRRNAHGVGAQLRKARVSLRGYEPAYLGVDVREVLERCEAGEHRVAGGVQPSLWVAWTPPRLELRPELLRGDEPELGARERA